VENISKLTPILYEKNETNFNHNGLGKLTKLLAYEIDEVLNGEFEAFFEYPANGRLADKIDNEMLIKAKPNKKDEPHVFKVYDYELDTFTQTYLIYARSKNIEDLKNNVILDVNVKNLSPTQAWNLAKNNALDPVVTTFYSDITTASSVHWERRSLLSTIAGQEGSMIQYWGGEIKHGINRISLFRRRGQDNVTTVRHGKNLDGLKATYSTKGLVTAIVPYYVKGDDKSIYGDVVKSQYINNYPSTYYDIIEYNDEALGLSREDEPESGYSDSTIKTALNKVAKRYFDENIGKDLPSINMEISLEDISQTKEYEQFKDFEQIEIGDTITVYSKKFNVNINAKVRRVVYNGLTDKNELVEVGTARRSLYDDVRDEFKKVETELQEGIDHAMTSANGKNTNYYGTADPNEAGLVGQNNDSYFRTNGQLKELWIYRDGMWYLEVGDLTGEQIRAEVEQAQQDIAEAQATADNAITEIEVAIDAAGFTSLSDSLTGIQQISQTAQSNAENALTHSLNAISDASTALSNSTDALSQVANIDVRVDDVEGTLELKADKQEVDTLSGIVDTHTLDIQANSESLALKANQDTVDTLAGTVTSLGTEFDIVAGQVNSRVWNTDIETAIDGIEVGGRNLIISSDVTPRTYVASDGSLTSAGGHFLTDFIEVKANEFYTISMLLQRNGYSRIAYYDIDKNFIKRDLFQNQEITQIKPEQDGFIRWAPDVNISISDYVPGYKIERGNKATDWTPAPEDTLARFDHIETEWTQTFDTFSQTVAGIDGRVSKQEQTVSGMESVVYDPETGLSSLNTQLANLIQVAVTGEEMTGAISILENNINARVEKGDVINQINISDENILIQANKIMALGDVVVDGKLTITDEFIAPNAQIDGAKIADATIGSAKIANLDVNKISGNTSNFVLSNWNNISSSVSVDGSGLAIKNTDGSWNSHLGVNGYEFWRNGNEHGSLSTRVARDNNGGPIDGRHSISLFARKDAYISLDYEGSQSGGNGFRALTIGGETGKIFMNNIYPASTPEDYDNGFIFGTANTSTGLIFRHSLASTNKGIFMYGSNRIDLQVDDLRIYSPTTLYGSINANEYSIERINIAEFTGNNKIFRSTSGNFAVSASNHLHLEAGGVLQMTVNKSGNEVDLWSALDMNGWNITGIGRLGMEGNASLTFRNTGYIRRDSSGRLAITAYSGAQGVIALGVGTETSWSDSMRITSTQTVMYVPLNMNGNNITNQSDERLKTNILDHRESSLDKISRFNFVDFEWLKDGREDFGVIAQQVRKVAPELILEDTDGYLSLNNSLLNMMTSHAVQELNMKHESVADVVDKHTDTIHKLQQELSKANRRIEELEGVA